MNKLQEAAARVHEEHLRTGGVERVTLERLFVALVEPETDDEPLGYVNLGGLDEYKLSGQGTMILYPEPSEDADVPVYLVPPSSGTNDALVTALADAQMNVHCLEGSVQQAREELIEQYGEIERLKGQLGAARQALRSKQKNDEQDRP